jgi:hypothetical protein
MTRAHPARNINFKLCVDRDEEKLCPESPVAPISHTLKLTAPTIQPTSRCYEHLCLNIAAPTIAHITFTNKAG